MGVPEAVGSNVPYLMKNVPNFVKNVPNFVNNVPSIPKCFPRCGLTPNHFLMCSKMKSWTIHVQMGDLEVIESNVPNLMNDVPNFVKDVPRVPKYVSRWDRPQSLSYEFLNEIMGHPCSDGAPRSDRIGCTKFN